MAQNFRGEHKRKPAAADSKQKTRTRAVRTGTNGVGWKEGRKGLCAVQKCGTAMVKRGEHRWFMYRTRRRTKNRMCVREVGQSKGVVVGTQGCTEREGERERER